MTTLGTPVSLGRRTRTGRLELEFGVRHGQTALLRDLQKAPLMVVRPFRLPCGTLMVFIVNPTGGVLGGDHSEIHVEAGAGTRVLILTQSATRVQPSPGASGPPRNCTFTSGSGHGWSTTPSAPCPLRAAAFASTCGLIWARGRVRAARNPGERAGADGRAARLGRLPQRGQRVRCAGARLPRPPALQAGAAQPRAGGARR
ncbi:urease accessory protein UreD [Deinococcus radiodurans]|nr:urease accessory protein UreD [Deinococcus radiodurans]